MEYSREDIIEKVNEALKNPATLYNSDFVKYIGAVGNEPYTEIAAEAILKNPDPQLLIDIEKITRQRSYQTESHKKLANCEKTENSNRDEEWVAKKMYCKTFAYIGKILDFQTPLKNVRSDVAGKVDLLSYNKSENTAYFLELKKSCSNEPLLRCILEAYTYWKIVDREKLFSDFDIAADAQLRKAVLIFKSCDAYSHFHDEKYAAVNSLMSKLNVDLFVLSEDSSEVIESYKH